MLRPNLSLGPGPPHGRRRGLTPTNGPATLTCVLRHTQHPLKTPFYREAHHQTPIYFFMIVY